MTLSTMKRAFDWLVTASKEMKSINFNFMGGEPTMRWREIAQFCKWARAKGSAMGKDVTFSMTSNLTLWDDEIRSFVDEYGFGILMSIDGCPEVQDAQRPAKNGKKMSAIVERWAKSMLVTRPRSTARATIHPKYVGKFFDSMKYLYDIGFREVAVSSSEYEQWNAEEFSELQRQLLLVETLVVESHQAGTPFNLSILKYFQNKVIHKQFMGEQVAFRKNPCGAGKGYLMIDYIGDIWPCHRFDGADFDAGQGGQFRMGNIFAAGFNYELQRAFLDFDHSKIHKDSCTKCPANPVCGGYCPAANVSSTGNLYTPHDSYCAWVQLCFASAESAYSRLKRIGGATFSRFVADIANAEDDGR